MKRIPEYHLELDGNEQNILVADRTREWPSSVGPNDLYEFCVREFKMDRLAEEMVILICTNAKLRPTSVSVLSKGSANASILDTRSVYVRALLAGAVSIVLAHNHPSGDPTPSGDDITTTNRVAEAGKVVGVNLVDHIVVGKNSFYSILKGKKGYVNERND